MMAEGVCVKTSLLVCVWCVCVCQLAQGHPLRRRSISEVQLMHNVREHQQVADRQDWLQLKLNNILIPTHTHTQAQPSPSHTLSNASPAHTQISPSSNAQTHTRASSSSASSSSHTQTRVLASSDKRAKSKRRTLSSLDIPTRSRTLKPLPRTKTLDTPIRRADTPIRIRNTSLKTLNTPLATSPNNTLRTLKTIHTPLTHPDLTHTPLTSLGNKKAGHLPKSTQQHPENP